jgi:hypothetical protein
VFTVQLTVCRRSTDWRVSFRTARRKLTVRTLSLLVARFVSFWTDPQE